MKTVERIRKDLKNLADPEKALVLQRFFKTGAGEYGEGDVFLGVMVPQLREIAIRYFPSADFNDLKEILGSKVHEERMVALLILVLKHKSENSERIVRFYLNNLKHVNNWDLVDLTAPSILGAYLFDKDRSVLYKLARSRNVWEKRVAILATMHFIRNGDFEDTFKIAEILIGDNHDLIHKATGWMLREVGKRNPAAEEAFLKSNYTKMPRTMLRYAIERLSEKKRKFYLGSRERR